MRNPEQLDRIRSFILTVRGKEVIIDYDLAEFYEVTKKHFREVIKRNLARFPEEFMFQLTRQEFDHLKAYHPNLSLRNRKKLPFAFTEQGILQASSLFNTRKAINTNINIIRTVIASGEFKFSV